MDVSTECTVTERNCKKRKYVSLLCLLLVVSGGQLCAQKAMTADVLRTVDAAFAAKSSDTLATVLERYVSVSDYAELESYTLKKIRQQVVGNELDFAREAALLLIDNNLDNGEAIALYSSITKAIDRRTALLQEQKEKERVLAEKRQAEDDRNRTSLQKEYAQVTNVSSGETFYYNLGKSGYSPIDWDINMGLADVLLTVNGSGTAVKYGLALDASFFYTGESVTAGAQAFADIQLLTFNGEQSVVSSVKFIPSVAFSPVSDSLFFRFGVFAQLMEAVFVTPAAGIGFRAGTAGGVAFDGFADYYPGHFAYKDMNAAFAAGAAVSVPIVKAEAVNIGFKAGISDTVYMRKSGVENNIKCIFSIGVGKND